MILLVAVYATGMVLMGLVKVCGRGVQIWMNGDER